MDLNFYHLKCNPFPVTPDPVSPFLSPSHQAALRTIIEGIEAREGFVALMGVAGLGKTTILHTYLARIDQRRVKTVCLTATGLSLRDLLVILCQSFGLEGATDALAVLAHHLRRRLLHESKQGQNVALIIDDAHDLPVRTLWNLSKLSDLMQTASMGQLVQIVLVGRTEFAHKCNLPELRQLKQRLIRHSTLSPLSKKESLAYIQHRLANASIQKTPVFTRTALTRIVKRAQGSPRVLNTLCAKALIAGLSSRQNPISAKIARRVLADFSQKSTSPLARWGLGPRHPRAMTRSKTNTPTVPPRRDGSILSFCATLATNEQGRAIEIR